jgi:hypothetical protein
MTGFVEIRLSPISVSSSARAYSTCMPLKLTMSTEPEQIYRLFNDVWRRCLAAVGVRCEFEIAQWPIYGISHIGSAGWGTTYTEMCFGTDGVQSAPTLG